MTTKPVNNAGMPNPMIAPRAADTARAMDVKGAASAIGSPAAGLAGKSSSEAAKGSNVQISSGGKDRAEAMQKAFDIARSTPEVREDRVASLKKQIQDGTYQVDSGKIADSMLREAVKDHLAEAGER